MSNKRLLAPAALLLAGSLVACGQTGTASPAASAPAASPSAAVTDAASPAASPSASAPTTSASPAASASGSPDAASPDTAGDGGGGDLAASIPTAVGEVTLTVSETDPQQYIAANVNRQLTPLLTALGRTADDLEIARASGSSPTATLFIDAVRIEGADAEALLSGFQTAAELAPGLDIEAGDVGGKSVVTVTTGSYVLRTYATGDTVYYVQSPDPALVDEATALLP